jgi:predicted DsbA family dithiol-disulfide isomerase
VTTNADVQRRLVVDVWSDVMCPFCYMGDALLSKALEQFPHTASFEIRYRSYQLMPYLPADRAVNVNELLEREKGFSRAQAEAMNAQVATRGKDVGLDYHFDKALAVNTRAAHRLSHLAKQEGKQHAMMLRLFRASFTEGKQEDRPRRVRKAASISPHGHVPGVHATAAQRGSSVSTG